MYIYKVTAPEWHGGWDTYDSFICVANSPKEARKLHPSWVEEGPCAAWDNQLNWYELEFEGYESWIPGSRLNELEVTYIGRAASRYKEAKVLLASFNAG